MTILHEDLSRAVWRKSTRTTGDASNCVEVARIPGVVAVRDSKNPDGPKLLLSCEALDLLLNEVKTGTYDL